MNSKSRFRVKITTDANLPLLLGRVCIRTVYAPHNISPISVQFDYADIHGSTEDDGCRLKRSVYRAKVTLRITSRNPQLSAEIYLDWRELPNVAQL